MVVGKNSCMAMVSSPVRMTMLRKAMLLSRHSGKPTKRLGKTNNKIQKTEEGRNWENHSQLKDNEVD